MKNEYDLSPARRGAVLKSKNKTRITIYLDNDILDAFRKRADACGSGYQTLINDALRGYLESSAKPLDAQTLRRILREELKQAG